MDDREVEALPRLLDEVALEPVRLAGRVAGDQQLVCLEVVEGVVDRLHRLRVADLPPRADATIVKRGDGGLEARPSGIHRAIGVADVVPQPVS